MNQQPSLSTEFVFQDEKRRTEDDLKTFYINRFSDLLNLVESNRLSVHRKRVPDISICKNNTCFILARSLTSSSDKIITMLDGNKYGDPQKRRMYKIGKFDCYNGYFRLEKTLGIRVVKVSSESASDDFHGLYSKFYPFILVHFYIRADRCGKVGRPRKIKKSIYSDEESEIKINCVSDPEESYQPPQTRRQKDVEKVVIFYFNSQFPINKENMLTLFCQQLNQFQWKNHSLNKVEKEEEVQVKSDFISKFQNYQIPGYQASKSVDSNLDEEIAQLQKQIFEGERILRHKEIKLFELQEQFLQQNSGKKNSSLPFQNDIKFVD